MSELRDLYQQVILDHNKRPCNFRVMDDCHHTAEGFNPLCGDRVTMYLKLDSDVVTDISFQGTGCAISTASASMLTEALKGKSRAHAEAVFKRFHKMVTRDGTGGDDASLIDDPLLGKLAVFGGVCEFPMRVKCATLAWHTLTAALKGADETVTTE